MEKKYDFKKEWPKIKEELMRIKEDAVLLAQKGEEGLKRISIQGKMHVDVAALKLKREHLFHLIGKVYVMAKPVQVPNAQIEKLLGELKDIDNELKALERRIKSASAGSKKKTSKSN